MHLSTLINGFSQLQAAATNIRDPTGRAVTGALREIHWENIGNNICEVAVHGAASATRAYDHAELMFRDIKWDHVGTEAARAIKDNPQMVLLPAGIVAGAMTGGLLMGPTLGAAGFSSIGPVTG